MPRPVLVALAAWAAGCALPEEPPPLSAVEVGALAVSAPCVERRESFVVSVTLTNPTAAAGATDVVVQARQYGNVARFEVLLPPGESREVSSVATIDHAGRYALYALGGDVRAGEVVVRVVDPKAGERCGRA